MTRVCSVAYAGFSFGTVAGMNLVILFKTILCFPPTSFLELSLCLPLLSISFSLVLRDSFLSFLIEGISSFSSLISLYGCFEDVTTWSSVSIGVLDGLSTATGEAERFFSCEGCSAVAGFKYSLVSNDLNNNSTNGLVSEK